MVEWDDGMMYYMAYTPSRTAEILTESLTIPTSCSTIYTHDGHIDTRTWLGLMDKLNIKLIGWMVLQDPWNPLCCDPKWFISTDRRNVPKYTLLHH
jgi:hypothetical protein